MFNKRFVVLVTLALLAGAPRAGGTAEGDVRQELDALLTSLEGGEGARPKVDPTANGGSSVGPAAAASEEETGGLGTGGAEPRPAQQPPAEQRVKSNFVYDGTKWTTFDKQEKEDKINRRRELARSKRMVNGGYVIQGNEELQTAVGLYCSDQAAAQATYGPISTWNTGKVTDMSYLFGNRGHCSTYDTFNADISEWDGKCGAVQRLFVSHHQQLAHKV